ncbi:uncharacterized protein LOC110419401 [Herrania umbratica]|uniref:Uncharacterized protein LOC110419401 n=1 Tax=Herrania umbratica TaxID=108875 RepID=A0A6J1ANH9_9ROSI|nr:uncharacterized protein LOC110419401 [Herrania umbratica]
MVGTGFEEIDPKAFSSSSSSMEDFGEPNSDWTNSDHGLEEFLKMEMPSPESLMSLDFGSQSIQSVLSFDPSMLNQTTGIQFTGQQHDQHATSGVMADMNQANVHLGQQGSDISLTSRSKINDPKVLTDDKVTRKRQRDRDYRERRRKERMETKDNLEALGEENEHLEKENESLKRENALMNQTLESQAEEIKQLRNDLNNMKFEHGKQNILVQILSSELLANPELQLENQRLKDENVRLRNKVDVNDYSSQLIKENGSLRIENMVLRVQNDALCEKIANDNG